MEPIIREESMREVEPSTFDGTMSNLIEIKNGIPRQVQYQLLLPINITIGKGEQVAIYGLNGAGKSLIVNVLTGAIPLKGEGAKYGFEGPASQNIKYISFRDSYGAADKSYYHQQRWNSWDRDSQPTVAEMLPSGGDANLRSSLFSLFAIESMLAKELILLSSGELRKFQLVKALLGNPSILILEDPFVGLDASTREQLALLLDQISSSGTIQLLLVLSRLDDIPAFTTHVIEVVGGECRDKVSYSAFMQKSAATTKPQRILSPSDEQRILSLPTIESPHNCESIIELDDITIKYDQYTILENLTWQLKRGEQWTLSGENGAGKSTLLSLICADIPQGYACRLHLFGRKRGSGESIWDIKRHIGYVSPEMHRAYQQTASCIEIVASGLHDTIGLYKRMKDEECEVCQFWMDMFGIGELSSRSFKLISSGEQRLVLLARAFVKDPELLILDEPLHGLDEQNRRRALDVIETFCRRPNKSLIFVSHYPEELPRTITHSLHLRRVRPVTRANA